jgi:hypothetical protein
MTDTPIHPHAEADGHTDCDGTVCEVCGCCEHCEGDRPCDCVSKTAPKGFECRGRGCGCEGEDDPRWRQRVARGPGSAAPPAEVPR